jgi:trypsin
MAAVRTTHDMGGGLMRIGLCGGTLATSDKVLTGGLWTVRSLWVHPGYSHTANVNDVAVVTLDVAIEDAKTLPLASSDDSGLYTPGTAATVLGWGNTDDSNPAPGSENQLQGAAITLLSETECASAWDLDDNDRHQVVCAGGTLDGKDACQGDSGGPLVVAGKLVGVVSYGGQCQELHSPGVYANVSYFHDELQKQL